MLELNSRTIDIAYDGKLYKLSYPKKKHIVFMQKGLEEAKLPHEKTEIMCEVLAMLGMPEEVIEELEIAHIEQIFAKLTEISEKKS